MSSTASSIFSDDFHKFTCLFCSSGEILQAKRIKYACLSHHTHPILDESTGVKIYSKPRLMTITLDAQCDCGKCCSCVFLKENAPKQMTGLVSVVCDQHQLPNLRGRSLYQYCFFCTYFKTYKCEKCNQIELIDHPGLFSLDQDHQEVCDCGHINPLKDIPLSPDKF